MIAVQRHVASFSAVGEATDTADSGKGSAVSESDFLNHACLLSDRPQTKCPNTMMMYLSCQRLSSIGFKGTYREKLLKQ